MLQQTQVSRVVEKFNEFIVKFPSIEDVACASNEEILKIWNGLGYNSRALRLKKSCEIVVKEKNGIIPSEYELLRLLPGIGEYTASAILCFSFRKPIVVTDVNVVRVYSRFFTKLEYTTEVLNETEIKQNLHSLMPKENASEFFQAIMDVARIFCKKSAPNCNECPLTEKCLSSNKLTFKKVIKRNEPSYLGFPRRIWRGRILKILSQKSPILFEEVIEQLEMYEHRDWVLSVIHLMVQDNLLTFNENDHTIRFST